MVVNKNRWVLLVFHVKRPPTVFAGGLLVVWLIF